MTAEELVRKVLVEHLNVSPDECKPEANLHDDLGADSLDLVKMLMMAEDELGVEINEKKLENVTTVGSMVKLMEQYV